MNSSTQVVAALLDEMEQTVKLLLAAIQTARQLQAKAMAEKAN